MKALRFAVGLALLVGLAGCGGSDPTLMPDVMGRRLDVALSEIKRAGFEDKVEVVGRGTFGIVNKSNWKVCDQSPAAGQVLKGAPRVTVDRSCGDGATKSTDGVTESTTTTSPPPPTAPPATTAAPTTAPPATMAAPTTAKPQPLVATTARPAPTTAATSPPMTAGVYYANCAEARAAGAAPMSRGEPGYRAGLDRDGDGTACDK